MNRFIPLLLGLPIPSEKIKRFRQAYKHSNIESSRFSSDCKPVCPNIEVWQYAFKPPGFKATLISEKPISTQKKFWKNSNEARIIAMTLFGNKPVYLDGLMEFIQSIQRLDQVNPRLSSYSDFTIRVYVAKRNPKNRVIGKLKGATSQRFIDKLIKQGVEIAYVDNHLNHVALDATFWRFMIAAENMPEGQRLRYFIRDVDWLLTAMDVYILADWIRGQQAFHRMNVAPLCISPLTAGLWGGVHTGKSPFEDLKNQIKYYPYRFQYGDDELFLRDFTWEYIKSSGSVLTHIIEKRSFLNRLIEPYSNSCQEPTKDFCDYYSVKNHCHDHFIPKNILFSIDDLSLRKSLNTIDDAYFFLDLSDPDISSVLQEAEMVE